MIFEGARYYFNQQSPSLRAKRSNPFLSLPGLTRQSICFAKLFRSVMDARVKPAHDEDWIASSQLLLATTANAPAAPP
jgi:hypothetical protein